MTREKIFNGIINWTTIIMLWILFYSILAGLGWIIYDIIVTAESFVDQIILPLMVIPLTVLMFLAANVGLIFATKAISKLDCYEFIFKR